MDAHERERKLRLAESAAASAVLNGATPDEVRQRIEIGIADALRIERRNTSAAPPPAKPKHDDGALSRWAKAVG